MSNDGVENCDWSSDINFEIIKNEHEEFSGSFKVMSLINEKGEKLIAIRPLVEYIVDGDGVVSISFEGDKETFRAFINDKYSYEEIIYRPYVLNSDSYDGILNCPSVIIDKRTSSDKISEYEVYEARRMITALNNVGTTSFGYESERSFDDKNERLAQMVRKMNRVNPRIERRIRGLREIYNVEGIDLINNLLAVSVDPEQYDNVYNLMGFKREPLVYQDGSTDLSTAYFDRSFNNMFIQKNKQKKLSKNN